MFIKINPSSGNRIAMRGGRAVLLTLPETGTEPTKLTDHSGNGNDGTYHNITDVQLSSGLWVWSLNGSTSYIDLGDIFNFERTDSFCLMCWIKTSVDGKHLITRMSTYGDRGYGARIIGDALGLYLINDNTPFHMTQIRSDTTLTDNAWHHTVAQNKALSEGDASDIELYVDGSLESMSTESDTLGARTIQAAVNFIIGGRSGDYEWDGYIALPRIYNYALTQAEITALYNNQSVWFS